MFETAMYGSGLKGGKEKGEKKRKRVPLSVNEKLSRSIVKYADSKVN